MCLATFCPDAAENSWFLTLLLSTMMSKHHFTIKDQEKTHKCYLDEHDRIFVYDQEGNIRAVSAPTGITKLEDAKEAAQKMLDSLSKKK
jgi:hypothetical protein